MPGTERAPFFGHTTIFNEQPPIAARISTDTAQVIVNGFNLLTFAVPINEDPLDHRAWQSLWTPTVPSRFTITVRGWYLFGGSCEIEAVVSPRYIIELRRNAVCMSRSETAAGITWTSVSCTTLVPCAAGDVLEVYIYLDAGGPVNTNPFQSMPNMWAIRAG